MPGHNLYTYMLKKIKLVMLLIGIIFAVGGVYLFILMDFTVLGSEGSLTDGLGLAMVSSDQATGFAKILADLVSFIPAFASAVHITTWQYVAVRILDVVLLFMGFGFLLYGLIGPKNEEEMKNAVGGEDGSELE